MPLKSHKLSLEEDDNPEYYTLYKDMNEMVSRYNAIQERIHNTRVKGWLHLKSRRKLSSVSPDLESLMTDYLKWRNRADNYLLKPHLVITEATDSGTVFLHYMDNLRASTQQMEDRISVVADNYRYVDAKISSSLNFRIAITSFVLTFLGLVFTLYALLK